MPSKEIKELRQAGKLEEALTMAKSELEAQPDNIWGKRNISWVYYEYLKKYATEFNCDDFIGILNKLKGLNLLENEVMIFDNAAWQIASIIFKIQKIEPVDYFKINTMFDIVKEFHFTKPSDSYSLLYKSFHKGYQNWSRYLEFSDWWGFENFRPEDYSTEQYNGRQIMALAEQAYIAYSKCLIEGEPLDAYGKQKRIDIDKINSYLPKLDKIIEEYPTYQYPPYFKAKLLLALGEDDNVLKAFLPFAKQKRNDFWVWELMAEIFETDTEMQFACYCKALSLKTREDFIVKTRQNFAELLVSKELYEEAKTEISKIIKTRKKHGWKINNQLSQWITTDWYTNNDTFKDNNILYNKHLKKAEEILFQDVPTEKVVVEFVNRDKKIINFIKSKTYHGFFNYEDLLKKPVIGDILVVRLQPIGKEGFYKALSIEKCTEKDLGDLDIVKPINNVLRRNEGQRFGFIDDVFVSPDLINNHKLNNNDLIDGLALLSFNKKKDAWGWKLIKIN
ncbi:DUF7017 domain-containing protein [Maribacter ulvicola]|uniref:Tetratricopeptide repeat-containing protein n=1 Tax=Maribacter ulvicola TaxID=228959 RepID=A0A1N6WRF2_9FLAO|nr:hypothetical protein [Maribacter ulvicola]SIQ92617.1 hypothetical protein SAMN05421797_104192 [Maribacter ulvicola]